MSTLKNRTVRWDKSIDELAQQLAIERGYLPERTNGGVSAFLSDLIKEEDRNNRLTLREPTTSYMQHLKRQSSKSNVKRNE